MFFLFLEPTETPLINLHCIQFGVVSAFQRFTTLSVKVSCPVIRGCSELPCAP